MRTRAAASLQRKIEELDLTHKQVEQRLGLAVESGQVTRLCNGQQIPGRKLAFRIFEEFGIGMEGWEMPDDAPKSPTGDAAA